jgi:hypothetical protein|tara:strand:- start:1053 stop:1712 length:660 start_codon:yes stop_codon:yes gene_type:complete
MYFTQVHEDAIVEYVATDCIKRRTELYVKYIGPTFDEMVDKIVYTYKFTNLPNIDYLRDECKIWLITILDKYNQDKGYKAFSYFSVITKNWFIQQTKRARKNIKREVGMDYISGEAHLKHVSTENPYPAEREHAEFVNSLKVEILSWERADLKENEEKVLAAIKILFQSAEDIEIFNKKAIYMYIREITGLSTKQIVSNLNRMKVKYRVFRDKWEGGEL